MPYPALKKQYNLKSRQELIDYDYIDQLNHEEKEWLNKFTEEWANAKLSKDPSKNLHKTKKLRKECYDRNNARNRCMLTRANAAGISDELSEKEPDKKNIEENLIDKIDLILKKESSKQSK